MATGLSISTTSNLNTTQKTMMIKAAHAFEPSAPDPSLVAQEDLPQGHYQAIVATYARLSDAAQLTEGVDVSQIEQLVTNTLTINPAEHGIIVTSSKKLARRQGDENVLSTTAELLGISLRAREAKDIIALYDNFSKSVGGTSTTLDITHVRGTVAYLTTDNNTSYGPAPMPLNFLAHAEMISDIIADLSDPGAVVSSRDGLSASMLQRWWKGSDRVYSVSVYHSGYMSRDGDDDAKGAIFHKNALLEVEEGEAEPTNEPDNSLRVVEYGLFKSWGEGERADAHGVEMLFDAAATV